MPFLFNQCDRDQHNGPVIIEVDFDYSPTVVYSHNKPFIVYDDRSWSMMTIQFPS
jgi:hypothetical protein